MSQQIPGVNNDLQLVAIGDKTSSREGEAMPVLFHPELTADLRSAVDALRERYSAHMQRIAAKAAGALRAEAGVSADTKVLWSEAKRTAALEELAEQFRLAGLKPSQINCYG